jgi:HEAT repeat protein
MTRPSIDCLLRDLVSEDLECRDRAAQTLGNLSLGIGQLPEIEEISNENEWGGDAQFDNLILETLARPEFPAAEVLRGLIESLVVYSNEFYAVADQGVFAKNWFNRRFAFTFAAKRVLESAGNLSAVVLPEITNMLKDSTLRSTAARMIAKIGRDAKTAAPVLLELMAQHGAYEAPYEIGRALAAVASFHDDVLTELAQRLESGTSNERQGIAATLRELGPRATRAICPLVRATRNGDAAVRALAAAALGTVGRSNEEAVTALIVAARDPEWYVRGNAIKSLGELECRSEDVIPILINALDDPSGDPDWNVRDCAVQSLAQFGEKATSAVCSLVAHLWDRSSEYVEGGSVAARHEPDPLVIEALGKIGIGAKEAIPKLRQLRDSSDDSLRDTLDKALLSIQGRS